MGKTELMKRYEAETGKCATWTDWHGRKFLTDDYIAWIDSEVRQEVKDFLATTKKKQLKSITPKQHQHQKEK